MRGWIQIGFLAVAAVACLGTSKTLFGKKLQTPRVSAPAGVKLVGQPRAALKENVNNQGCFAKQRLDFVLNTELRNDSGSPLKVHPDWIHLEVGFGKKSRKFRVKRATVLVRDSQNKIIRAATLATGTQGTLQVHATAILSKKRLEKVQWITLKVDLKPTPVVLEFRDIHKLKTQSMR